jgi:hypothetical protein
MIYEDNLMAKTTTTIQHEDTNDVDVRINKRKRIIEEFSIVGRLNTLYAENNTDENTDVIDLMDVLKPTSRRLFKEIKDQFEYQTSEATLEKPKSKYKQKRRSMATKGLKDRDVIKKTGQRTYIVNPYLIVPPIEYQKDILAKWDSLP